MGVIFFELLFGQKPFGHNMSQEKILKEAIIPSQAREVVFPTKPNVTGECKVSLAR